MKSHQPNRNRCGINPTSTLVHHNDFSLLLEISQNFDDETELIDTLPIHQQPSLGATLWSGEHQDVESSFQCVRDDYY